jgi:S-formylglutathione hydrolase FrmB
VLLHGRGMRPTDLLWKELYDELERLGRRAPALLLVDGGDHSYYHDRHDFAWGTHTLRAIEATRRDLHASSKTAIGGFSMGGFGAFDLARSKAFCAVGGHSPAIFPSGAETPAGAFDSAEDFAAHDLLRLAREGARFHGARLWLDVGRDDPFRATTIELAKLSGARLNVWPGGHDTRYWRSHVSDYLGFYADALANC